MYVSTCMYVWHSYAYMQKERERDTEGGGQTERASLGGALVISKSVFRKRKDLRSQISFRKY